MADDAQRAALDAEIQRIAAIPDPVEAFQAASELVERQNAFRGDAARLRSQLAQQLWEAGDVSMARVGERLGVSRQRAYQLIKRAREDRP